jgi:excisionase family DNA binding protein
MSGQNSDSEKIKTSDLNRGDTLVTVKQVAARLGVSVRTVARLLSRGVIPSVLVPVRNRRVSALDVEAHVASLNEQASR